MQELLTLLYSTRCIGYPRVGVTFKAASTIILGFLIAVKDPGREIHIINEEAPACQDGIDWTGGLEPRPLAARPYRRLSSRLFSR